MKGGDIWISRKGGILEKGGEGMTPLTNHGNWIIEIFK